MEFLKGGTKQYEDLVDYEEAQEARGLVELLLLYRVTRSTGIPLSTLGRMDAEEVQIMMDIESAHVQHFSEKIKNARANQKYAEIVTTELLAILVEGNLLL